MPKKWVKVRYFAVLRERLGLDEERFEIPADALAGGVLDAVVERHPGVAAYRSRLLLAVNEELVPASAPVADGDEIALLPPVSGGAGRVLLTAAPLSVDAILAEVAHPGAGGIAVFLGVVRDTNAGRRVDRIDYEAFDSMAIREMTKVLDELAAEHPEARVAIAHRTGTLAVGDTSVLIAASAPHRALAFEACRAAIDRLKERVPIWKREHGPDGVDWVGL